MSVPPRPDPPVVGKVTHHSVELYWDKAGEGETKKGDGRIRFSIQEDEKVGGWGNVYTGYAKNHLFDGLESRTEYRYRLRAANSHGYSEWSPSVTVSTTREPLTGEHLHRAFAYQEDLVKVRHILDSGEVQVDVPDKYGLSPLMSAAQKGYLNIVELLIEYGADVNFQNDSGKNALMLSCFAGHIEVVKLLKSHGAQWDVRDKGGSTPMHWAVDSANTQLLRWIILDGCPVDIRDRNSGWSPLMRACTLGGNTEVAKTLINAGANVNTKDNDGKTPLMIAALNGHLSLVELLIQKGADVHVKNEFGKTAIDFAGSFDRRRVSKFFEELKLKEKAKKKELVS
ncbi:fibronectin type 3 and ankyrin repeat domains protein 1-like [Saccoglossus kowalevskii]|uniref:Fibronectin type 3 and ankyrin repeat domains protein 1-like n=1 Tax=Saccoglossus kowalevskii TaxID=10224 RepID=A0ABM0GUZ2_SACKO|nr:PREDICTED: fibronectin type 3 and ankyrin repeat domains protein 1-like [Saccoglossus kowalevskii]